LCDIAMPGMDGLEFATRMRADSRFRGVPLVAVTGVTGQPVLMANWIAGFDGHIDKPDHSRAACPGTSWRGRDTTTEIAPIR
jgi:CheY-like chemotaxis protein